MNLRKSIESAIVQALNEIGPATARAVEAHEDVLRACRLSKLKCRHQLEMMTAKGLIQSNGAAQEALYSASASRDTLKRQPACTAL